MESRVLPASTTYSPDRPPGGGAAESLGPYELREKLGRGGMGTVYRAVHARLKRPAAVKLLRSDRIAHPRCVARFLREMEAVGRLDHPNLVRAYDAGEVDGRYFLAMELVVGADLCHVVDRAGPLRVADACEAVRQAACGLHSAHAHGLVHRDVKPSNLMVTRDGIIKLLDLGLARLLDAETDEPGNTASDHILGSGDYLAPEQGEDPRQADAQSDLYALGCVLYFLLAGRAPFDDTRHNTFGRKLLAHATERVPPIAQLRPELPEGLAALIAQMLAKRPADRPANMVAVAQALAAWTDGANLRALVAHVPVEGIPGLQDWAEVDTPAEWAFGETGRDRTRSRAAELRSAADRPRRRLRAKLLAAGFAALVVAAALLLPRTRVELRTPEPLGAAALVQRPAPLPNAAGWTLETRGARAATTHLALSPDEKYLAAGDAAGCIRIWQAATGDLVRIVVEPSPIRGLAWLCCNRRLAVAAGTLRLWDAETGHCLWQATFSEDEAATALDYEPQGTLATGHRNGAVRLWYLPKQRLFLSFPAHRTPVTALRFSPDGARLASGDAGRTIGIWSIPRGEPLERFDDAEPGAIRRLAWSPDGARLASCGGGSHVTLWDPADGFRPRRETAASQPVADLGWSSDGQRFFSVSGGEQGMEYSVLWDGEVRKQIERMLMMPNAATAMAWLRDGTGVYCGVRTGELGVFSPGAATARSFRPAAAVRTTATAWAPDAPLVLLGDCCGWTRLWNVDEARQVFAAQTSRHPVWTLAWHPEGDRFAAGHTDGRLLVVNAINGSLLHELACNGHVFDVAFSPDGRWFATAEEHGLCRVWDAATGEEAFQIPLEPRHVVNAVAWSPDSRSLAFSAWDARVRVVDVERQTVAAAWGSGQGVVGWMVWEPGGRELLTSGPQGWIAHWDSSDGTLLRRQDGCLRDLNRRSNRLGSLQGSCASNGLRGIAPDGAQTVRPMEGSLWELFDLSDNETRFFLCPMANGQWLSVDPAGHYQGDFSTLETPVYVVATELGQENYTPAEFTQRYGWRNEPEKVGNSENKPMSAQNGELPAVP